jgi:hypothetical protein
MSNDHPPFEPDELDELLSADLDGELAAAARDFGLRADEVTARLQATPGVDQRRAALAAARDLLGQAPELDELLDARLRAKAVRAAEDAIAVRAAARRERRRHVLQAVSGIAAAAVLVLAVGAALRHDSPSSKSSSSAPAAEQASGDGATGSGAKVTTNPDSLGTFSDVHQLGIAAVARSVVPQTTNASAVPGASTQSRASTTAPNLASGTATDDPKAKNATAPTSADSSFDFAARAAGRRCGVPPHVPVTGKLVLRTSAVLSGQPVVVLVFAADGGRTVLIEGPGCTLKNLQQFR